MAEAYALAGSIAKGPSIAHCITKRQLEAEWNVTIDQALEMEARAQARCMETDDFKRAYEAFANKQKPVFQGS
jgi:enoyl-CoA hydratase/carnithine racemase